MKLIFTSLEQGLIFAILAMGMFITYKILDISDLSVEGTYPLGAFVTAKIIMAGLNPWLGILAGFFAGMLGGLLTAFLHLKVKINALLSGILTMTILYSVGLRVNGTSNVPLSGKPSVFDLGAGSLVVDVGGVPLDLNVVIIILVLAIAIKLIMDNYLKTESGYLLQATGDNETLVRSLGVNADKYKVIGLMLANGMIGMSGALMAQYQHFAEMTMKNGIIVIALASIIVGDTIARGNSALRGTTRAIVGAVVYKLIGGLAIWLGLNPNDLNMINGLIVVGFIAYNNAVGARGIRKMRERSTDAQR